MSFGIHSVKRRLHFILKLPSRSFVWVIRPPLILYSHVLTHETCPSGLKWTSSLAWSQMTTARYLEVIYLGKLSYAASLKVQEKYARQLLDKLSQSKSDKAMTACLQKLVLVEHNPVYTVGIRKKGYSSADVEKLQQLGADFHYTNRGGLITFHGPGQLVVYPIIYLKNFNIGMKTYVSQLEQTVIDTCRHFGISAHTAPDTGVWVGDNKIAAIGVHGSRYVTTHGLALNCNTDLRWFDYIVPCGLEGKGVTSLTKETSHQVTVTEATKPLLKAFIKQFDCTLVD